MCLALLRLDFAAAWAANPGLLLLSPLILGLVGWQVMDYVRTGDTLCDPKKIVKLQAVQFAEPCYSRAIAPKVRGQEEKIGTGLNRLNEEDPTFTVVNNGETHQTVISGAGDIQIDVLVSKL